MSGSLGPDQPWCELRLTSSTLSRRFPIIRQSPTCGGGDCCLAGVTWQNLAFAACFSFPCFFFLSLVFIRPPRHHSIFLPFPPCPIWRRALKGAFFLFTSTTKNSALASVFQVVWVLRYSSVHVKKRMTGRCSIWDQLLKLVLRIGKLVFILH